MLCLPVPACGYGLRYSHFAHLENLLRVSAFLHSCFVRIAAELHAERAKRGGLAMCSHSGMEHVHSLLTTASFVARCDGCLSKQYHLPVGH